MTSSRFIPVTVAISLAIAALPITSHAAKHAKKPTPAAHKADPNETFIRQAYAYQASAVESLDVNKAFLYVASDFIEVAPNGQTITREAVVAQLYALFQKISESHSVIRQKRKIVRIDISPMTATVVVSSLVTLQVPNNDPSKLPHQMEASGGTSRDTWVRTQTGWIMQKSEILSLK